MKETMSGCFFLNTVCVHAKIKVTY